ncbi:hypothetical protein H257_15464 [Aphanomyces astaci]|uniref:Uncharacterized protein n=1 Tax=Aphanomyces astaci TaxID=112090 RepID=W4FPR6_APHAT|nr:hypothetical protein H257_15464 [Aphanomyces astaci]ETV68658.1 hypothetical protein H257_15464 [Aphanomyces astaci]|eukprot:XP_009841883.1 hypothetical protein H257_15464 [Aphanomyces astaci]
MASLRPDPGKQQSIPPTLSDTSTVPTPMAIIIVHRNGVPTGILVPATGIIRQPHPTSSQNDSASDTTECPVDPLLTALQLRSTCAADKFLARHDGHTTKRANPRWPSISQNTLICKRTSSLPCQSGSSILLVM